MRRPARFSRWTKALTATALLVAAGLASSCDDAEDQLGMRVATARAERGNLRVTVTEGGELESANPVTLRSEVEGRTTIIWLVDEGSVVKKDDVVVRLDRAELEDRMEQRELDVERARSELAQSVEAVEIQKKKNSEEVRDAQTKLALAINALDAYRQGTFLLERRQLEAAVTLSKERYARAKDEAEASARLFEQKFLSRTELEADDLAEKTAAEEVKIAEGRLEQLEKWEREAELLKLQSDVDVRRLAMERMKQQAESELKQKQDLLANRQRSYDLQVERRDKVVSMLDKSVITAPADGLVVYSRERSRWGRGDPVSEGKEVKEREEILRIPDLSSMLVKVDIHESSIKRVQTGQRATIEVDAIPGRRFAGTVSRVSPVPSSQSSWMNPDLKVYETEVVLDETIDEMKPGMHARVQIMVAALDGVLMVPLQAVRESGRRSFVYCKEDQEVQLREVKTGMEDDVAVQILSGLEEGEEVFLATPTGAPGLPEAELAGPAPGSAAAKAQTPAAGGAPASAAGGGSPARDGEKTRPSRRRGSDMTPEQRKAMQERMKDMSPEERKKMMERFRQGKPEQDDD